MKKFEQEQYVLFEQEELEGYIGEFLGIEQRESQGVLRAIASVHGLLIERSYKVWSFSHLTFQEYLVAKWFVERNNFQSLLQNITNYRWREVFLLVVGMLTNADFILRLIKQNIDVFLAGDETLQKLMTWIDKRAELVEVPYQRSAVRAFYLEIELDCAYAITGIGLVRSHILIPILAPYLASYEYEYERFIKDFLNIKFTPNLELDFIPKLLFDIEFKRDLQKLKDILPETDNSSQQQFEQWWQLCSSNWMRCLRMIVIKHHNYHGIGHDWQLNEQQRELLRLYHQANSLLVECLNNSYEFGSKFRQAIEETILLPIAEIEKRKLGNIE